MHRLYLIHWNGDEAEALAEPLRSAGMEVTLESQDGGRAAKAINSNRPDAVIISLARLPSHGRAVAEHLLSRSATRDLPILFVGGSPDAIAKAQQLAPAARFGQLAELPGTLLALLAT